MSPTPTTRRTGLAAPVHSTTRAPDPRLSGVVVGSYVTMLPLETRRGFQFRRLPEATTHVFLLSEDASPAGPALVVRGPLSTLTPIEHGPQPAEIVGCEFEAGAARALLGRPIAELCDQAVPLEALWGPEARTLLGRLLALPTHEARLSALEDALASRVARSEVDTRTSREAVRLLESEPGGLSVAELAERLGLSARQLQRRLLDDVGFPPKRCARILRFRALVKAAGRRRWAEAAAALGYSDQAHMIADFRALVGCSPGRFFEEEDFVDAFLPLGWVLTPRAGV